MWPFNNLHITWELPWTKPRPENCDLGADWDMEQYDFPYPHYKVMGELHTLDGWLGHSEIWCWKKGKELPEPIGGSEFCIYFRNKSTIDLVQLYDPNTKRPVDLPSDEEQRVRLAVIKSKNKWRLF